jgi:anti-sigma factor RsiW
MENHLTENELIEYQFKLGTQEEQEASSKHLAGCAECRERLEKLIKKFAALDLLRADAHVSEELISQVLEQDKRSFHYINRPGWEQSLRYWSPALCC